MDSGIDLNPPPWVFSRKTIPSFGKGKVLGVALALCWASSRACSFFLENPTAWLQICNFASSGLENGQLGLKCADLVIWLLSRLG